MVNNWVKRGGGSGDYKIKSVTITMSWERDVLSEISRVESRQEFFDLRVVWAIKVKVEVTGDDEFMGSSGSKR